MTAPTPPPFQPPPGHELTKKKSWFARHKILTGLGALIIVGIIASAAGGGGATDTNNASDDSPNTTATTATKAPQKPKPAAIVTTSKAMIALLESNALKAKSTYEDKRVTVTGFVGNIDASGDYFSLDPEKDAFIITGIQVQTDDKFKDQIANFTKGQKVTVTGKITNVGEVMGYSLEAETIK